MLTIPFTLDEGAHPPVKAHRDDAAYDLALKAPTTIRSYAETVLNTGVHVAIPTGHVGLVTLRSSIGKQGLILTNGVGVVDPGYTGPILLSVRNNRNWHLNYKPGDRIAQLLITPTANVQLEQTPTLKPSERGNGGFGSTGTN